jgi:hypothetical protein
MDDHQSNTNLNSVHVTRCKSGAEMANNRRPILFALIAIAAAIVPAIVIAASHSLSAGSEAAAPTYLPSISDLMISTIQPRQERLWWAGQDKNWEFAGYELGNLRGAFNRMGLAHPIGRDILFPEMISSVMERPLDELNSAIQSKNGSAFAKAYTDLTEACNSCHQALNHGVVEIKTPNRASESDLITSRASQK